MRPAVRDLHFSLHPVFTPAIDQARDGQGACLLLNLAQMYYFLRGRWQNGVLIESDAGTAAPTFAFTGGTETPCELHISAKIVLVRLA